MQKKWFWVLPSNAPSTDMAPLAPLPLDLAKLFVVCTGASYLMKYGSLARLVDEHCHLIIVYPLQDLLVNPPLVVDTLLSMPRA